MVILTPESLKRFELDRQERVRRLSLHASHLVLEADPVCGDYIICYPLIQGRIEVLFSLSRVVFLAILAKETV